MKITFREDPTLPADELLICCRQATPQVLGMLGVLRACDNRLCGEKDGQTFVLSTKDILYFESVDKKTFAYTCADVFETSLRLYELEERLGSDSFFRASKSMVLNITKISSLRPEPAGRMEATLENGERTTISRQYVPTLKQKLGM